MDFKRIARIFIIAFGLLNIYLFTSVIERQDTQNISSQPTTDILENINASDIELPIDLSMTDEKKFEVYSLQVNENNDLAEALNNSELHTGTINNAGIYYRSFPSNPIVLEGDAESGYTQKDIDRLKEFLQSEMVLFGEEYVFYNFDKESNRFVFTKKLKVYQL